VGRRVRAWLLAIFGCTGSELLRVRAVAANQTTVRSCAGCYRPQSWAAIALVS